MPKLKTNKSMAKRIRITRNGKTIRRRPGRRHLLSHKSSRRKRRLRTTTSVSKRYADKFKRAL